MEQQPLSLVEARTSAARRRVEDSGGLLQHIFLWLVSADGWSPQSSMNRLQFRLSMTDLARAGTVCRAWHAACSSDGVWETVCARATSARMLRALHAGQPAGGKVVRAAWAQIVHLGLIGCIYFDCEKCLYISEA